jgi:hypothetical protein
MIDIPEVDDVTLAFPAHVIGTLLPKWDDLPDEFKESSHRACRLAGIYFYEGGIFPLPKEGVDHEKASRVIRACLRSFEPKHEHKMGGVGYLLDQWYEVPEDIQTLRKDSPENT